MNPKPLERVMIYLFTLESVRRIYGLNGAGVRPNQTRTEIVLWSSLSLIRTLAHKSLISLSSNLESSLNAVIVSLNSFDSGNNFSFSDSNFGLFKTLNANYKPYTILGLCNGSFLNEFAKAIDSQPKTE